MPCWHQFEEVQARAQVRRRLDISLWRQWRQVRGMLYDRELAVGVGVAQLHLNCGNRAHSRILPLACGGLAVQKVQYRQTLMINQ